MIPLKTLSPVYSPPVVTWALIGLNVAVFLWARGGGPEEYLRKQLEYSVIAQNVVGPRATLLLYEGEQVAAVVEGQVFPVQPGVDPDRIEPRPSRSGVQWVFRRGFGDSVPLDAVDQEIHPWLAILTSMFMHAGWMHLIGNMWFLLVFGPNVEDVLGKAWFLLFYLASGVAAIAAQMLQDPHSVIPLLGASGAIAGVMGGLAARFPGAQVLTLIPIFLYSVAHLSVWIFMLIYIGLQIFWSMRDTQSNGGVAWWAHIGGFVAGYVLIRFLPIAKGWRAVFARSRPDPFS